MNAKSKAGATAGKQKRATKSAKNVVGAVSRTPSFNSSGEFPYIQAFRAGQDRAQLRDQDWNFCDLSNKDRATLSAACWYEYARESQHVRETMRAWLDLQKIQEQLRPFMRRIAEQRARSRQVIRAQPKPIIVDETNWEGVAEAEMLVRASMYDERLPPELCKALIEAHPAEHDLREIESKAGVGAPRLRTLAKYLVEDRPWLLIPAEDRREAIATAFANRFEVPRSAEGKKHFLAKRAFDRVRWCDFVPPDFGSGKLRENGVSRDLHYREITRDGSVEPWRSAGDEVLPILIRWGAFTDQEIIDDFTSWVKSKLGRPCEWQEVAKGSGRGKTSWFIAALKELAAMRLMHAKPPEKGRELFADVYLTRHSNGRRGELDESNFRRLARKCLKTFDFLFPYGQKPQHHSTWTERHRRG